MTKWDRQRISNAQAGISMVEITVAMVILGLITGGVFSTFAFSRKVGWRSETQIMVQSHAQQISEKLRLAVGGNLADGTTLNPGYYVDAIMPSPPNAANGAAPTTAAWLNLPAEMQRFQTAAGDGVYLYVERADEDNNGITNEDYDGDTQIGRFFGTGAVTRTDAKRVRVRLRWTTPTQ